MKTVRARRLNGIEDEDAADRLEDKCSLARLIVPMGLMAPTWFIRDRKWVGEEAPAKVPGGVGAR